MRKFIISLMLVLLPACGSTLSPEDLEPPIENANPPLEDLSGGGGTDLASEPFDLDLALELGRLCLQSYQMLTDFNNGTTFTLPAPYTLVNQYLTNESFNGVSAAGVALPIAFIATKDDNIYVVFRGTVTIIEWIEDAMVAQVPYTFVSDGGMTEQGFTGVYATINQAMLQEVQQLAQTGNYNNLFITGHSLGAALAVVAVPDFVAHTPFKQPVMYNFAGPRVGDPKFSNEVYNALDINSIRVANTNDLVPTLPPILVEVLVNNQFETFFYEHIDTAQPITFGNPVSGPTDFQDIEFNHIMCNYYNRLCEFTSDPSMCMAAADGADGCNAP